MNSPHKGQWRGNVDVFFKLRLNKRLRKQSWGWWFDTPSRSFWCHCNSFWKPYGQYKSVLPCYADNDDERLNGSTRVWKRICASNGYIHRGHIIAGDQMTSVGWIGAVYLTYYNAILLTGLLLEPLICSSFMVVNIFDVDCVHYNAVITSAMASQITSPTIVYPSVYSRRRSIENIKAPRHWSLWGEFTGDRWIPRTKGQ